MLQSLYVPSHNPPSPSLIAHRSVNEEVIIRLKWGQTEYKGRLISVDSYMNIQLSNTEEYIDGKSTGALGQVLIRSVDSDEVSGAIAGILELRHGFMWETAEGCISV